MVILLETRENGRDGELTSLGKRVVIVAVDQLLTTNPITLSGETGRMTEIARDIWLWPSLTGRQIKFVQSRADDGNWLDGLRQSFDSVLLDCTALETASGAMEGALMADATVLVVEAGRSTREHIRQAQRALQLRGASLAGCILLRKK
jgi:hypothetical protein